MEPPRTGHHLMWSPGGGKRYLRDESDPHAIYEQIWSYRQLCSAVAWAIVLGFTLGFVVTAGIMSCIT